MSAVSRATEGIELGAPIYAGGLCGFDGHAGLYSSRSLGTAELRRTLESLEWDLQVSAATKQDLTVFHPMTRGGRVERYRRASELLTAWLTEDDGGYDERTWSQVVAELQANPVRFRE